MPIERTASRPGGPATGADLTVAVIHHQTPDLLEDCLASVRSAAPAARLLVVDTGEKAPLGPDWESDHPGIRLLREPNHSFSAAVNAALRACRTALFVHLNADVVVGENTFDRLRDALDASGAAMAGPLARDGEGRLQRNGLPYRWHQWRVRVPGGWTDAPWLSGCLQYLRMDAVRRVGGMDTSLRLYNEDLEWCLRLRAAGERCVLVSTEITHYGGSSTPATERPLIEGLRGGFQLTRRYRGPLARRLHRAALLVATSVLASLARRPEQRAAYRRVAAMLRHGDASESPFGSTLGSENPLFDRRAATP
jgi:N-acetylglucosaminyl-diphospho-decaprenol L-rhamnosyltransferase